MQQRFVMQCWKKWLVITSLVLLPILTIVKSIRNREEVKTAFRLMHPIAKSETGGTVSYIKAPIPLNSPSVYPETLSGLGLSRRIGNCMMGMKSCPNFCSGTN
eukprot:11446781-Ditylum_brightwellii.AAC.1